MSNVDDVIEEALDRIRMSKHPKYSLLLNGGHTGGKPDRATRQELEKPGCLISKGDQRTGVWVCCESDIYAVGDRGIFLKKGQRFVATWEWDGKTWRVAKVDYLQPHTPMPWWKVFWYALTGKKSTKKTPIPRVHVVREGKQ